MTSEIEQGQELFQRISASSRFDWPSNQRGPIGLNAVVSQMMAILEDDVPLYVGHAVEEIDSEAIEGRIVALTKTLLVMTTIKDGKPTTKALPLRAAESVEVLNAGQLLNGWANETHRLKFAMKIDGETLTFPIGEHPVDRHLEETVPAMRAVVRALKRVE